MPFFKAKRHAPPRSQAIENKTKKNGLRHAMFNNVGDKYIGEWKDDKKTGKGVMLTKNGEILYEGDMEQNHRHGFGVLAHRIQNTDVFKLRYRGDWKNGRMDGSGVRSYPDESFYVGEFKNGKRHGYGRQYYLDGTFFAGDYMNDHRDGFGVHIRSDGNLYEGNWEDGKEEGEGIYYHFHDGRIQHGVWHKGGCVFSQMKDLRFRQCAFDPTHIIPEIHLKDPDRVCQLATERALTGRWDPCFDEDYMTYDKLSSLSQDRCNER